MRARVQRRARVMRSRASLRSAAAFPAIPRRGEGGEWQISPIPVGAGRMLGMPIAISRVDELILAHLAGGERRVLSLVVAIGKQLSHEKVLKPNLSSMVKSSLRGLVASRTIRDFDGLYSL